MKKTKSKSKPAAATTPPVAARQAVQLGPLNALPDQLMVKGGDIVFKDGRTAQPTFDGLEGKTVTVVDRTFLQKLVASALDDNRQLNRAIEQRNIATYNLEQQNARITDLLAKQSALVEQVEQLQRDLRDERCARGALELAIELLGKGLGGR